jgi:hypothetical protein
LTRFVDVANLTGYGLCCSDALCAAARSTYSRTPRAMSWVCSSLTSFTGLAGIPTIRLPGGYSLPSGGTVEDGGSHAYEATALDLAAVHDGIVADDAVLAHYGRVAGVGVQDAAVRYIGARSDPYRLGV